MCYLKAKKRLIIVCIFCVPYLGCEKGGVEDLAGILVWAGISCDEGGLENR